MTPNQLLLLAVVSLIATAILAIGSRLIEDFSRRDLDIYCRRQRRGERFAEIMALHDKVVLGVESLQTLGTVLTIASGTLYFYQRAQTSGELQTNGFWGAAVFGSLAMLLLLNWIPVTLVKLFSAPLLTKSWPLWKLVASLAFPLTIGMTLLDKFLRRAAGKPEMTEEEGEEAFEDEIRAIVTSGMRDGFMEEDAREMIEGVMDLGDDTAFNIMTPRSKVDAISCIVEWPEMLDYITEVKRTRMPVFSESLDNVIGVLYAKDLLPELAKDASQRKNLTELAREPWFVPGSIPVDDLLQEFLATRKHLAVVVDEYNAVAGVVTIEDVLEEIVGEIHDESDAEEVSQVFEPIDSQTTRVVAQAQIEDVNDRLGIAIPESDVYDTLGGFVIAKLGYIPEPGEMIAENGYELLVLESDRRRIAFVQVKRLSQQRESA